jgi:hypothetical protein
MSKTNGAAHGDFMTVRDVIDSIVPGRKIKLWFSWPPDLFLMTSYVLKKTGAYRHVVNDKGWPFQEIQQLNDYVREWLMNIQQSLVTGAGDLVLPEPILKLQKEFDDLSARVKFNELKAMTPHAKRLAFLMVKIHVLADWSSQAFGILGAGTKDTAFVNYLANLLLVTRGSLSTVPKFHGIVIPKMRTPQSGLTLRSFSHHLTYHDTEVEVMWRSVPWVNSDQNTLNILCVPWPDEVRSVDFTPAMETFESVRYFAYQNGNEPKKRINGLVRQIMQLDRERGNVHMIVFPEMALSLEDYDYLLEYLKKKFENHELDRMPLVLCGVRRRDGNAEDNMVRLAAYFVGKWYDLSQTKHHRWKLNRSQLRQYELSSKFSTERNWFENIQIRQRRLSFFVPNGWLALCPLICEDLAQLEPVSEIIRGVGPTLLIALLMDGPQLKERWPARYASVFADDPGTAVLTMTSWGMLSKSRRVDETESRSQAHDSGKTNYSSIGLWKDQVKGWSNVDVGNSKSTSLLTISASFREEVTADGRTDYGSASVFKLDNILYPDDISDFEDDAVTKEVMSNMKREEDSIWRGDWADLRELTSATFAIDALISCCGQNWDRIEELIITSGMGQRHPVKAGEHYGYIKSLLFSSYEKPELAGIETDLKKWPTESLLWGMDEIGKWKKIFESAGKKVKNHTDAELFTFYKSLIAHAQEDLREKEDQISKLLSKGPSLKKAGSAGFKKYEIKLDEARIRKAIPLAILISVHNRLDSYRTRYLPRTTREIIDLFKNIEDLLSRHGRFTEFKPKRKGKA